MTNKALWLALALGTLLSGCGRSILYANGCENRLSLAYKRQECMACVSRPRPHVYLPDEPDGTRCRPR